MVFSAQALANTGHGKIPARAKHERESAQQVIPVFWRALRRGTIKRAGSQAAQGVALEIQSCRVREGLMDLAAPGASCRRRPLNLISPDACDKLLKDFSSQEKPGQIINTGASVCGLPQCGQSCPATIFNVAN